jgi:hypothetical protein
MKRYKAKVVTTTVHWITVHGDTAEEARAHVRELCTSNPCDVGMEPESETIDIPMILDYPGPLFVRDTK